MTRGDQREEGPLFNWLLWESPGGSVESTEAWFLQNFVVRGLALVDLDNPRPLGDLEALALWAPEAIKIIEQVAEDPLLRDSLLPSEQLAERQAALAALLDELHRARQEREQAATREAPIVEERVIELREHVEDAWSRNRLAAPLLAGVGRVVDQPDVPVRHEVLIFSGRHGFTSQASAIDLISDDLGQRLADAETVELAAVAVEAGTQVQDATADEAGQRIDEIIADPGFEPDCIFLPFDFDLEAVVVDRRSIDRGGDAEPPRGVPAAAAQWFVGERQGIPVFSLPSLTERRVVCVRLGELELARPPLEDEDELALHLQGFEFDEARRAIQAGVVNVVGAGSVEERARALQLQVRITAGVRSTIRATGDSSRWFRLVDDAQPPVDAVPLNEP